jgi:hypothetical protein
MESRDVDVCGSLTKNIDIRQQAFGMNGHFIARYRSDDLKRDRASTPEKVMQAAKGNAQRLHCDGPFASRPLTVPILPLDPYRERLPLRSRCPAKA